MVPSVAGNTQADDTLPSIVGMGGATYWIVSGCIPNCSEMPDLPPPRGTHSTATPPPPTPRTKPPLPSPPPPPPRVLRPTVGWGGG